MNNEEVTNEGTEDNESRFQKIKNHVRRNRTQYLAMGVTAVVTAVGTAAYITLKYGMTEEEMNDRVFVGLRAKIGGAFNKTNLTVQTISVYGNKIGRPGVPVIDETTGKQYASMTLAADHIGATPQAVQQQLHGRRDHVNGHKFAFAE